MTVLAVVGAQWGDEGKGKVVDLVANEADVVARYGGGANAGHTLVVGGKKTVIRLVPSGIMHGRTTCVLGAGMVIDPRVLGTELAALEESGVLGSRARVVVSERAHLVLPQHVRIDELRESKVGAIGTTKRGIGPAYEDKVARVGVRMVDLKDDATLVAKVRVSLARWAPVAAALGGALPSEDEVMAELRSAGAVIVDLVGDVSDVLEAAIREKKRVVLEGAQGTMLDVDHGSYPYVTSSSVLSGGAAAGVGIAPTRIDRVIGITKAYATRVGGGPFPSEIEGELGDRIRTAGGEFGSVTGRPRRCGWLDIPVLRHAVRLNGMSELAVTKLDVLRGIGRVKIVVAYELDGKRLDYPPASGLERCIPIFEDLPGWDEDLSGVRTQKELPSRVRRFLSRVAKLSGARIGTIGVGPDREQTIRVLDPWR